MISVVAKVPVSTITSIKDRFSKDEWLSLACKAAMNSRSLTGFRNPARFKIFDFLLEENDLEMLIGEYPEVSLLGVWDDDGKPHRGYRFDEVAWRAAQPQDATYNSQGEITGWVDSRELKPVHQFAGHALRTFT